jgi:dihydroxyacid dehydratase/phosphogluconate dehydratase
MELNKYSKTITQDETQPAAQAMLYGIGLTEEDLNKAQVGIVSMGYREIHVICTLTIWQNIKTGFGRKI